METFTPQEITIAVEPLLRIQGYRNLDKVRAPIKKVAAKMAARAQQLAEPIAVYRKVPIKSVDSNSVTLGAGTVFHSEEFPRFLTGCGEVVVFVLTIGTAFDAEVQALIEEDKILELLFFENAGWIGVESATKAFSRHLQAMARQQDCQLTRRLAPGYQNWRLEEQVSFFSLFETGVLPVRLLESCAMLPKMSRSGLYGLKPSS